MERGERRSMSFKPEAEDVAYLRTFKFEDLTFRGTIEFRSACCQPISDVMTVAAFHLGLMNKTDELSALIDNDTAIYHNGYTVLELRKLLNRRVLPAFVDEDGLYNLAHSVLDLCRDGLVERNLGEEVFLKPLYERIEKRTNPAKAMLESLKNGESIENIIRSYS